MDINPTTGARIFKARAGSGIRPFLFIAGAILAPSLIIWGLVWLVPLFVPILVTGILLFIALIWLVIGLVVSRAGSSVYYEVSDQDLTLIGGPVRYTIPLSSIKRVYKRDLDMRLSNRSMVRATAVNLPNLALSNVQYKDIGPLKMCATSQWKDITLIVTDKDTYGVTPADEEDFEQAIRPRGDF